MKFKKIIFCAIALLLPGTALQAGEGAVAFLKVPVGARAAALGGAYVALARDASAVYWNPAGLGYAYNFKFTSSAVATRLGDNGPFPAIESSHVFAAAAIPLGRFGVLGLGWKHFSNGDIEQRDNEGEILGSFDNSENALFFAYGIEIVPNRMSIGASFKVVQQELTHESGATASGRGFSFGLSYRVNHVLTVGLRADDEIRMEWENGHADSTAFRGIAGAALSLWDERITVVADLEQGRDRGLKLNSGIELSFKRGSRLNGSGVRFHELALRSGLDDKFLENRPAGTDFRKESNFVYGFGLGLLIERTVLSIDYSYGSYRIGSQNRVTVSLSF